MPIKIKRLLAGLIDHIVSIVIASLISQIVITLCGNDNILFKVIPFVAVYFILILFKDNFFGNASIGKKILKIKVVATKQAKVSFIINLKRSLPLVLLPIEILLIIIDNKRIGDLWANTEVVEV
ncbi:MAG: RDD family protein [Clostridia bacterium]